MKKRAIQILTFIVFFISLQTVFNPSDEIKRIYRPEILLSNNVIKICQGTSVDLLEYIEVVNNEQNEEVKVNIDHVEELNEGEHDVVYSISDVEEKASLIILSKVDDEDKDGYSNFEEYEAGTDYLNKNSKPIYDSMPTIEETIPTTFEVNTFIYGLEATAYDFYDGNLEVEINNNININKVGTYSVSLKAKDHVGNITYIKKDINVVDTIKPSVSASYNKEWTNNDVNVSLYAYDAGSGISKIEYSYDNVNFTHTNGSNIVLTNSNTVYIRSVDYVGNISDVILITPMIDKTLPTLTFENDTFEASNVETFNCDNYIAQDYESGIKEVYTEDNVNKNKVGVYTCTYYVKDNAGNINVIEKEINIIDTTAPIIKNTNIEIDINDIENIDSYIEFEDNSDNTLEIVKTNSNLKAEIGEYEIEYLVTDEYGNSNNIKINVTVYNNFNEIP